MLRIDETRVGSGTVNCQTRAIREGKRRAYDRSPTPRGCQRDCCVRVGSNKAAAAGAVRLLSNDQTDEGGNTYATAGLRGLSCLSSTIRHFLCSGWSLAVIYDRAQSRVLVGTVEQDPPPR